MDEDNTQETSPPDVMELNQSLHVDDLPDDVLLTVFKYLDIKSRVRIERVSQRWQQLSRRVWKSQKHLSLVGAFPSHPEPPEQPLTTCVLEALLLRCEGCVRTLDLCFASRSLKSDAGGVISVLCPNLENLDLSGVRINNTSVKLLASGCPKLKSVVLLRCTEIDDTGVRKLLSLCKYLEHLNVSAMHKLSGECFEDAGPGLRRLQLDGCWGITMEGLATIATKCSSLVELSLSRCIQATDGELRLLCEHLKALKTFRLSGSFPGLTPASISAIANLSQLEDLDLSHNRHVNEQAIRAICAGCTKLRSLDLTGCRNRTCDANLVALAACSSLRSLKLNYSGVTDGGLKGIATQGRLHNVEVRGCNKVTHEGVQALVKQCPHLQLLDLSRCRLVGNRAVTDCLDFVHERPSVVTLVVGGTRVRADELDLDPKGKLKLDSRDYSAGFYDADRWDHPGYYDESVYELEYWDDGYDHDFEGDPHEEIWDLGMADDEEGGVLPADLAGGGGGGGGEWGIPPGYLLDMDALTSDEEDDLFHNYYDDYDPEYEYDFDHPLEDDDEEPLSEDNDAWAQGYDDYDDVPAQDDDDDLGIVNLFHEPQEDEDDGAWVYDSCVVFAGLVDKLQEVVAPRPEAWVEMVHLIGGYSQEEGKNGDGGQEDRAAEIVDLLDDPQEEEIADLMDDPQEEEDDEAQAPDNLEIADLMDDPQEELWGAQEGFEYEDLLDDPQEEDYPEYDDGGMDSF